MTSSQLGEPVIRTPTCRGCDHFACRHGHGTPWLALSAVPELPGRGPPMWPVTTRTHLVNFYRANYA